MMPSWLLLEIWQLNFLSVMSIIGFCCPELVENLSRNPPQLTLVHIGEDVQLRIITQDRLPDSKEFRGSIWHPISKMGMGAAAAILAQTVTFPIDTVRRRMQMSGAQGTCIRYATFW
jgi:hypothetical protein